MIYGLSRSIARITIGEQLRGKTRVIATSKIYI